MSIGQGRLKIQCVHLVDGLPGSGLEFSFDGLLENQLEVTSLSTSQFPVPCSLQCFCLGTHNWPPPLCKGSKTPGKNATPEQEKKWKEPI